MVASYPFLNLCHMTIPRNCRTIFAMTPAKALTFFDTRGRTWKHFQYRLRADQIVFKKGMVHTLSPKRCYKVLRDL